LVINSFTQLRDGKILLL